MDPAFIDYRGERFRLQTSDRYYQSDRKDADERLLHRRIYTDHNGPIPPGFDVHHKDDDWRNNDPDNLEAILQSEHRSQHMTARWSDPADRAIFEAGLAKAREAAKSWHASPEGIAWHREHGARTWVGRERTSVVCVECGDGFMAAFPNRAKFCSGRCSQRTAKKRLAVA